MDIFPPDPSSAVGIVRLLIPDTKQVIDPANRGAGAEYIFSDAELNGFISLNSQRLKFAAADAIDAIARNEALVLKKIRSEDLQTDGPSVLNALAVSSQNLRQQAQRELEEVWASQSVDIVDYQPTLTPFDVFEATPMLGALWL